MRTDNVFVLCTGRCGSMTFAKACSHIANYTSGHETRCKRLGADRIAYPPGHIEIDNRLSWFLGRLDQTYGNRASYVHLIRDKEQTAHSCNQRWFHGGIMLAYCCGILTRQKTHRLDVCEDYWETVNENIRLFLKDKQRVLTVHLENAKDDFAAFWSWIEAEGDLSAALAEWDQRHNETPAPAEVQPSQTSRPMAVTRQMPAELIRALSSLRHANSWSMGLSQLLAVLNHILEKDAPNVLVVGCGADSPLYVLANSKGRTLFLEHDDHWIAKYPALSVVKVSYESRVHVPMDVPKVPHEAESLVETAWDCILVDGPPGWQPEHPGRQQSIFLAAQAIAADGVIFVHDYNRSWEKQCAAWYLGTPQQVITENGRGDLAIFRGSRLKPAQPATSAALAEWDQRHNETPASVADRSQQNAPMKTVWFGYGTPPEGA